MAAPTGKTEYSCLKIDVRGKEQGVGFLIGFSFSDYNRPWGTLQARTATQPRVSIGDAWRDEVMQAVFDAADHVFDTASGAKHIEKLTKTLAFLNEIYPDYQIASFNGVPALQIEATDGRRIDVNMSSDGVYSLGTSKKAASFTDINAHGAGGYGEHARKAYEFDGDDLVQTRSPKANHRPPSL